MPFRKKCAASALLPGALFLLLTPGAVTQVSDSQETEPFACMMSYDGPLTRACGLDKLNNEFVFVGTVVSSTPLSRMDFRLELRPEEVFLGAPAEKLEVETSQGACMPAFVSGDRWLFYVRRNSDDHKLSLEYGGGSEPEKDAKKQIDLLRRLQRMDNTGYLHGNVSRGEDRVEEGFKAVEFIGLPNHQVIATPVKGGKPRTALTDKSGHFAFESLPLGVYDLSANTAAGLWENEIGVEVEAHSCTWVGVELKPDGTIAGHVTTPDGKPPKYVEVYALDASEGSETSESTFTDEQGQYALHGLSAGSYLVRVKSDLDAGSASDSPIKPDIYYPGVPTRQHALEINLGKAERRLDIDFQVPFSAVPPANAPDAPADKPEN